MYITLIYCMHIFCYQIQIMKIILNKYLQKLINSTGMINYTEECLK